MANFDILEFDINGTVLTATATHYAVQNVDGSQTIFISNAGGFTYPVPGRPPATGTVDAIQVAATNGTPGITITGNLPSMSDLSTNVFAPVNGLRTQISWFSVVDQNLIGPDSLSSTQIVLTNTDGTKTIINGTGFIYSPIGAPISGAVTSIQRTQADGTSVISQLNGLNVGLLIASAALLDSFYSQMMVQSALAGDNTVTSNAGAGDTAFLKGGGGNDTIIGSAAGNDIADYAWATGPVIVDLDQDSASGAAGTDLLTDINGVFGSDFDDLIKGDGANNELTGGGGNDTLDGGGGDDLLKGMEGDDRYRVDSTSDSVVEIAGQGIDTVVSLLASYTLGANVENLIFDGDPNLSRVGIGNALDNYIQGFSAADILFGRDGNDILDAFGGSGNVLHGEGGNDMLIGAGAADTLIGGSGSDTLDGGLGTDQMLGGANNDLFIVDTTADVVVENANEGYDRVWSSAQSFTLSANVEELNVLAVGATGIGNSGDNLLSAGADGVTLIGAGGHDTYQVSRTDTVVTENAGAGYDRVWSSASSYTLSANVEELVVLADGATGTGNAGDNLLTALADGVTLSGAGGSDTYQVNRTDTVVNEVAGGGIEDRVWSSASSYTLSDHIEQIAVTATNATGTGNAADNLLFATAGGIALAGGGGDDTFVITRADTIATENSGEGRDTVWSTAASHTLSNDVEQLFVISDSATGTGNSGANTFIALGNSNVLTGNAGNDTYVLERTDTVVTENAGDGFDTVWSELASHTLSGNIEQIFVNAVGGTGIGNALNNTLIALKGGQTLEGGAGNDTYVLSLNDTTVTEAANAGADTIWSNLASHTLTANVEKLFVNAAGAVGTGNGADNTLIALSTAGNTLNGAGGSDILIGGAGNDIFLIQQGTLSDRIVGMQAGAGAGDVITLDGFNATFANVGAVLAALTDDGTDTALVLDGDDSIVIEGHVVADFDADDFVLV